MSSQLRVVILFSSDFSQFLSFYVVLKVIFRSLERFLMFYFLQIFSVSEFSMLFSRSSLDLCNISFLTLNTLPPSRYIRSLINSGEQKLKFLLPVIFVVRCPSLLLNDFDIILFFSFHNILLRCYLMLFLFYYLSITFFIIYLNIVMSEKLEEDLGATLLVWCEIGTQDN